MDDMYTRNFGSMHDELVRITEAEILLSFDSEAHTFREIRHWTDSSIAVTEEALNNLVSKGLVWKTNYYYGVPYKVQDEINRICQKGVETLVRKGI